MVKKKIVSIFGIMMLLMGSIALLVACDTGLRVLNEKEKYALELTKIIGSIRADDKCEIVVTSQDEDGLIVTNLIISGNDEQFSCSSVNSNEKLYRLDNISYIEIAEDESIKLSPIEAEIYNEKTEINRKYYNYINSINFNDAQWQLADNSLVNDFDKTITYHDNGDVLLQDGNIAVVLSKCEGIINPEDSQLESFDTVWQRILNSDCLSYNETKSDKGYTIYEEWGVNGNYQYHGKIDNAKGTRNEQSYIINDNYIALMSTLNNDQSISGIGSYNRMQILPNTEAVKINQIKDYLQSKLTEIEEDFKLSEMKFVGNKCSVSIGIFHTISVEYYNDKIIIESHYLLDKTSIIIDTSFSVNYEEFHNKLNNPYVSTMIDIVSGEIFGMEIKSSNMMTKGVLNDGYVRLMENAELSGEASVSYIDSIYITAGKHVDRYLSRKMVNIAGNDYRYEISDMGETAITQYYAEVLNEYISIENKGYLLDDLNYANASDNNGNYSFARGIYNGFPVMVEIREGNIHIYSIWNDSLDKVDHAVMLANDWEIDTDYNGKVIDITYKSMDNSDLYIPDIAEQNFIRNDFNKIFNNDKISLEFNGDNYYFSHNEYAAVVSEFGADLYIQIGKSKYRYYYGQQDISGKIIWTDSGLNISDSDFNNAIYEVQNNIVNIVQEYYNQCLGKELIDNKITFTYNDNGIVDNYKDYTLTMHGDHINICAEGFNMNLNKFSDINLDGVVK